MTGSLGTQVIFDESFIYRYGIIALIVRVKVILLKGIILVKENGQGLGHLCSKWFIIHLKWIIIFHKVYNGTLRLSDQKGKTDLSLNLIMDIIWGYCIYDKVNGLAWTSLRNTIYYWECSFRSLVVWLWN